MELKKLTANNFLSFKELIYDFVNHPVLIQGENLTDEDQENNGSGKSAIQAAIEYCLFKNTSRKVIDRKLINFSSDEAYVSLSIYCPLRNQELLIERYLHITKGGSSQVSVNGIVKHGFNDNMSAEIDKFIVEWIGIEKIDLQNYFVVNKERFKSIFSSSNREKMELINRFSNAQLISGINKIVQGKVSELENEWSRMNTNKARMIGSVKTLYSEKIDELSRDIKQEIADKMEAIEDKIKHNNYEIHENNLALVDVKSEIKNITSEINANASKGTALEVIINRFNSANNDKVVKDIEIKLSKSTIAINAEVAEQRKVSKEITDLNKMLREAEANLAGIITCPNCKHEFVLNGDINIEEERQELAEIKRFLKIYQDKIEKSETYVKILNKENGEIYHSLNRKRGFVERWEKRFSRIKKSILQEDNQWNQILSAKVKEQEAILSQITKSQNSVSILEEEKKHVHEISIDMDRVNNLNIKLKEHGKILQELNLKMRFIKSEIFNTAKWVVNFDKFNMFLANQSLKVLQGYCNKFLIDLKSNMQVKWEGSKMLASGKLKEEISSYILRDNEEREFWSFSGGERARLEYAMIFTLQEMINRTHKYGGLNFLSTDEIAEGLDAMGLSNLMKSLSGMNKTILITTHVVNKNVGENVLLVRKVNGVSNIVN